MDLVHSTKTEKGKNFNQLKGDLNLKEENGIIRCMGRLKNAPLSYDTKHPILLSRELIIKHCHHKVSHNGMGETLNELRTRFWMPQARNYVKKIIHKMHTLQNSS